MRATRALGGAVQRASFAALNSSRLSAQEQAYLRSVVVGGQWVPRRKHRAAKTLSPPCALCGREEGSLIHRPFRCSEVQDGEPSNMQGPFHAAVQSGALWKHESFAARALLPALKGRPPGYTVPYETRWTGDRSLITGVIHGDGSVYEGQDADLCVAGWGLVANTSTEQPVTVSGTLLFLIQDVDGAELFGLFMFLRIARAPAQYVTDSSFVEQGVYQRGREATVASASAWADLWRDVWCEIDAWGGLVTTSPCAR